MPGGKRAWCFTINNPGDELLALHESMRYLVYQRERGESGTEHYQGYCIMRGSVSMGAVKRALGHEGAHLEPRNGTHEQARAYCTKEDSRVSGPWELGEAPAGAGHRSDLDALAAAVKRGDTNAMIAEADPVGFMRNYKGVDALRQALHHPEMRPAVQTMVLYGGTGTGKTYWAYHHCPNLFRVNIPADVRGALWWDGYAGEDVILFDDFYGQIGLSTMLHLLDRYPMRLQVKGSFTVSAWTKVIITSNQDPMDWYKGTMPEPATFAAFIRRLTSMVKIDGRVDLPNHPIWE